MHICIKDDAKVMCRDMCPSKYRAHNANVAADVEIQMLNVHVCTTHWPWDCLILRHVRIHPGSNSFCA
jgi:hypothetical protein